MSGVTERPSGPWTVAGTACALAAIRLPDGGIAVSNAGTNEVHLFDAAGRFVLAAGREGQGPGEFERLTTILPYRRDSLLAFDSRARRITMFGSDGQFGRVAVALLRREGAVASSAPPTPLTIRDADDAVVLGEAVEGAVEIVVTGDGDLLDVADESPIPIVSPRGFWEMLQRRQ